MEHGYYHFNFRSNFPDSHYIILLVAPVSLPDRYVNGNSRGESWRFIISGQVRLLTCTHPFPESGTMPKMRTWLAIYILLASQHLCSKGNLTFRHQSQLVYILNVYIFILLNHTSHTVLPRDSQCNNHRLLDKNKKCQFMIIFPFFKATISRTGVFL